jgi:hypothetical protein
MYFIELRSCVLLVEVLASDEIRGKPLAIVLTGSDLVVDGEAGITAFEEAIRLDELLEERNLLEMRRQGFVQRAHHTFKIVGSSVGCELALLLRNWLTSCYSSS